MSVTLLVLIISLGLVSAQDISENITDNVTSDETLTTSDVSESNVDDFNFKDLSNNEIDSQNNEKGYDNSSLINKEDSNLKTASNNSSKKVTPTVIMNDYTVCRNQIVTFNARIKDENVTGNAIFKIDGINVSNRLSVQNGTVSYNFTVPVTWGVPTHTLTFVYSGDDNYNPVRVNSTLTLIPNVRMSDYTIYRNQTVTFYARIMDENVTGNAIFKINGITVSDLLPVQNGIVSSDFLVPVTWGVPTHTLTFVYSGDENNNPVRVNSTLTLEYDSDRIDANVKTQNYEVKYNKTVTLKVTLNSSATGKVAFKVKRKTVAVVNVNNGSAIYEYSPGDVLPGNYKLSIVYSGDYRFAEKRLDSNLTITKLNSRVITKSVTSKAGSTTLFNATVIDENGNYVRNVPVSFKINRGTIGNNTTDENGTALLEIPLDYKLEDSKYNLTVSSGTTKIILGNRTVVSLYLKQLSTKTKTTDISAKPGDKVTLSTTVVDENNNPVLKGYVTYYVNGKKYAVINVSSGFARYHYTLRGDTDTTINISAKYTGTWKYASSSAEGKISITELNTVTLAGNVLTKPGKASLFTANVTDEKLNPVNSGTVIFSLAGKVIGNDTVNNGTASYLYELPMLTAGKYNLMANYTGSAIYKPSYDTNILNVSRLKTTTTGGTYSVVVGKTIALKVSVYDESRYNVDNGTVKYYINNTYIGSANVVNGVAIFNYTAPVKFEGKLVKYVANYTQNGIYANSSYTGNLSITKQKDVYVSPSGKDTNLGNSTHPFKTIKTALQHVSLLGTIHLANGTYKESNLLINTSVKIIGSSPKSVIIDGAKSGKAIFNATIPTYSLEIAGVTIKNGKSTLSNSAGGIVSAGLLIVRNTLFDSNTATGTRSAGAIYSLASLNLTGVTFNNNSLSSSVSEGGAIRTINNNTTIVKCWFNNNTVSGTSTVGGAAIYSSNENLTIINTTFNKNVAKGKNVAGGAIKTVNGTFAVYNTTFTSNSINATNEAYGGAIAILTANSYMYNTTFNTNKINATTSASGGAIYNEFTQFEIENSKFTSNSISSKDVLGGAISTYYGLTSIVKSTFNKNTISTTNSTATGGVIYHYLGTLYMTNSSITNNLAKGPTVYAGAIYFSGSSMKINYTKFTNNSGKGINVSLAGAIYSDTELELLGCDFTNNTVLATSVGGGAIASLGNITVHKSNFIKNNASNVGNAITGINNTVDLSNNYWGSTSPTWTKLLHGLSSPTSYSKTKFSY